METTTSVNNTVSSAEYIKTRVDTQIEWYEGKARKNKRGYHVCQTLVILSGALIPLLVGYSNGNWERLKYVAGALGVLVAIMEGILSLHKYKENWLTYRGTAEA